jgi:hypothetical protein
MPVIRTQISALGENNRPDWCSVTSAGIFRVPATGGRFDRHFHDYNEYWLVFRGKAKILTEGQAYYVGRGDIVCTRAQDEHDVVEVYEDFEAFWFEEAGAPGARLGRSSPARMGRSEG